MHKTTKISGVELGNLLAFWHEIIQSHWRTAVRLLYSCKSRGGFSGGVQGGAHSPKIF